MPCAEDDLPGLLEKFLKYVEQEKEELVVTLHDFQRKYTDTFAGLKLKAGSEEHRLEWTDIYNSYVTILESRLDSFQKANNVDNDGMLQILGYLEAKHPEAWSPFEALLKSTGYMEFSQMLADGMCLCCGAPFVEPDEEEDT